MKNWYARMIDWVLSHLYDYNDYEHIVLETAHCSDCGHRGDLINGHCINLNTCLNRIWATPRRAPL